MRSGKIVVASASPSDRHLVHRATFNALQSTQAALAKPQTSSSLGCPKIFITTASAHGRCIRLRDDMCFCRETSSPPLGKQKREAGGRNSATCTK